MAGEEPLYRAADCGLSDHAAYCILLCRRLKGSRLLFNRSTGSEKHKESSYVKTGAWSGAWRRSRNIRWTDRVVHAGGQIAVGWNRGGLDVQGFDCWYSDRLFCEEVQFAASRNCIWACCRFGAGVCGSRHAERDRAALLFPDNAAWLYSGSCRWFRDPEVRQPCCKRFPMSRWSLLICATGASAPKTMLNPAG